MALPKNKSRKIAVSGVEYRYAISVTWKGGGEFEFNIAIQRDEGNGCKLLLKGLVARNFWLDFSDLVGEREIDESSYPTITPKHIAYFVERAVKEGWESAKSGKDFILNVNNEALTRRS